MTVTISVPHYTVKLVREKTKKYKVQGACRTLEDVFDILSWMGDLAEEQFVIVALDGHLNAIGVFMVSQGTLSESIVHPREIFKRLLACNAYRFIAAHNHPGGSLAPSLSDLKTTEQLVKCGKLMGVDMVDHIIFAGNKKTSIREAHPSLWED